MRSYTAKSADLTREALSSSAEISGPTGAVAAHDSAYWYSIHIRKRGSRRLGQGLRQPPGVAGGIFDASHAVPVPLVSWFLRNSCAHVQRTNDAWQRYPCTKT